MFLYFSFGIRRVGIGYVCWMGFMIEIVVDYVVGIVILRGLVFV